MLAVAVATASAINSHWKVFAKPVFGKLTY